MSYMYNTNPSTSHTTNGLTMSPTCTHPHPYRHLITRQGNTEIKPNPIKYFRPWESQEDGASSTTTSTQPLVDPVSVEVVKNKSHPVKENLTSIPSTTTIPPWSMAAIQQTMANALPLLHPPPMSPYGETITMDSILLNANPLYGNPAGNMPPLPTNYNLVSPYDFNMLRQQQHGSHFIPAPLRYAPYYPASPANSAAGHYYHPYVASHLPYRNNMTALYGQRAAVNPVHPLSMQYNMRAGIKQGPSSAPLSTSAHLVADIPYTAGFTRSQSLSSAQQNMVNTAPVPEVEVPPTSNQTANKQGNIKTNSQTKETANVNYTPPELTKSLLQAETSCNSEITNQKYIANVQEVEETPSTKKLQMLSNVLNLKDILPYRPNMARNRPRKEESKEQQLAREQNTIACRKYRRMRKIAKIMEQKSIEAESVSKLLKSISN